MGGTAPQLVHAERHREPRSRPEHPCHLPLMDAVVASGAEDRTTDAVERITGQPPLSYREFALAEFRI